MARSKRTSPEGDRNDESSLSKRAAAELEAMRAEFQQILQRWLPLFEELGYFSDPNNASLRVLLQVDTRPPYVCLVGLCSKAPLECLPPREQEVLRLLRQGLATKQIAKELRIKSTTVETYIRRLYGRFRVHSRVLLSQHARLLG